MKFLNINFYLKYLIINDINNYIKIFNILKYKSDLYL